MDIKTRIRIALGIEEEEVQFAMEDKLADGTIIVSDANELAEGVSVNVLVEDGTTIPLPVGSYETAGGVGFTVEEEGIVASVEEQAEEDEDDMGEDKEYEEDKEEMSDEHKELFAEIGSVVKELLEEVRGDIARLNAELDELRGENLAKDENIAELQEENVELSKQLKEQPSAEPVKARKFTTQTNNTPTLSRAEYNRLSSQEKFFYNLNN